MQFGKNINFLRKSKNLSQKELGEIFFVTNKAVSKWESGLSIPDVETMKKIAAFFNINIETLCDVDLQEKNKEQRKKDKKKRPFLKYLKPSILLGVFTIGLTFSLLWANGVIVFNTNNIDQKEETGGNEEPEPIIPVVTTAYTVDSVKLVKKSDSPLKINYSVEITLEDKTKTVDTVDLELLSRYSWSRKVDEETLKGSTYVVYSKQETQKQSLGEGKFVLDLDVTDLPNNGSWFFPKLYVNGEASDLSDSTNPFGNSISTSVSNYRIMQTDSTLNCPLVTRQAKSSEVPPGASFDFTGAEIALVNNRPQVIISGTCTNYTYDTLTTQLGYQLKHNGGANNEYVEFNSTLNSCPRITVENNTFKMSYFVDTLDKDSYPYYSRFKTTSAGSFVDFNQANCPNFSANSGDSVNYDGYKYEILWKNGSGAANAYNTFGVKLTKIS